jgi:GTP-binding protein
VLVHIVDLSAQGEDRAPLRDLAVLDHELARYSPELATKPQIVAANKIDLPDARERVPAFQAAMAARDVPVFPISAATGEGLGPLLDAVAQVLSGGALPTLARAERPRRRPKAGAGAGSAAIEEAARSGVAAAELSMPSTTSVSSESGPGAAPGKASTPGQPARRAVRGAPASKKKAPTAARSGAGAISKRGGKKTASRPSTTHRSAPTSAAGRKKTTGTRSSRKPARKGTR